MQQEESGDEALLVERSRRGDAAAFNELVALHQQKVFAILYNLTRNEQDAWDLAQETFLKAWRNIGRFQGQSSFFTWLYRIAMNLGIDAMRRKTVRGGAEFDDRVAASEAEPGAATLPAEEPPPHRNLENRELKARIDEAISRLSPEHRAVIVLREIEELSYEEIAEATGCSVGTVMSRLFYARKKLQTLLRDLHGTV